MYIFNLRDILLVLNQKNKKT